MKKLSVIVLLFAFSYGCKNDEQEASEVMTHHYRAEYGRIELLNNTDHEFINRFKITTKSESLERFFFNGSKLTSTSNQISSCIPFPLSLSNQFEELKEFNNLPLNGMFAVAPPKDENPFLARGPFGCIPRVPLKIETQDFKRIIRFHYKTEDSTRIFIPLAAALHHKSEDIPMRETISAYGVYYTCNDSIANEIEKIITFDNDATIGIDHPPTTDKELHNLLIIPKITIYYEDKKGNQFEKKF